MLDLLIEKTKILAVNSFKVKITTILMDKFVKKGNLSIKDKLDNSKIAEILTLIINS